MLISHHQEDIGDFHIRDLEITPKGQRSRCTFINWAMVNIFVNMHPGPRSNRLDEGHFDFRDLEMTPKGQSRSKVKMHFY